MTRAVVVFTDNAGVWWLRLLKPGFRHCFVAVETGAGWVMVEAMSHYTKVAAWTATECDPADWYRAQGMVALECWAAEPARRPAPWRPYSCVESAKRILGLRAGAVVTPWQLFRYLSNDRKKSIDMPGRAAYNPSRQHQNCACTPPINPIRRFFCICKQNKA